MMNGNSYEGRSPLDVAFFVVTVGGMILGAAGTVLNSPVLFVLAGVGVLAGLAYFALSQWMGD